ncbi:hypothetical protein HETIRDRAFT_453790 [Heterobasidion irregulare TC 32-1]|uniref:Uncharacterized protein n=1 Tax=Heterobasidion irregulare (strain TC 32-1) TaxID=747525 RepID=W4K0X7_HETIT|nr:uncharacterized protein HETIRDRAFT_453790 [Heterobasidion irregulare TC 32-1]ETW79359.1 hypothetical protein HETIRDRAFT_453790 [Heterobasidion irregulare TC 32-1]
MPMIVVDGNFAAVATAYPAHLQRPSPWHTSYLIILLIHAATLCPVRKLIALRVLSEMGIVKEAPEALRHLEAQRENGYANPIRISDPPTWLEHAGVGAKPPLLVGETSPTPPSASFRPGLMRQYTRSAVDDMGLPLDVHHVIWLALLRLARTWNTTLFWL